MPLKILILGIAGMLTAAAAALRGADAPPALADPFGLELLAAVRDVNRKLPAEARIRVLAGDPPAASE